MLKNLKMLIRLRKTHSCLGAHLNLQRRNAELSKKCGAERGLRGGYLPLRRLRGGGQSSCSSLNVIGWRMSGIRMAKKIVCSQFQVDTFKNHRVSMYMLQAV